MSDNHSERKKPVIVVDATTDVVYLTDEMAVEGTITDEQIRAVLRKFQPPPGVIPTDKEIIIDDSTAIAEPITEEFQEMVRKALSKGRPPRNPPPGGNG